MKKLVFLSCLGILFLFASCSAMIGDFKSLAKEVNFSVEFYADSLTSDNMDYSNPIKAAEKDKFGHPVKFDQPSIEGFDFLEKKLIQSGNEYKLHVLYSRKIIKVSFDGNGGLWQNGEAVNTISGKFGSTLNEPDYKELVYADHKFAGWAVDKEGTLDTPQIENTFPGADKTYFAKWELIIPTTAEYTINYYIEAVAADDETVVFNEKNYSLCGSDVCIGDIGALTDLKKESISLSKYEPAGESIEGFSLIEEIENKEIKEDGSAIVNVYLDRKSVVLTFDCGEDAKWSGEESSASKTVTGKYGTAIQYPENIVNPVSTSEAKFPVHKNPDLYKFAGWETEGGLLPAKFPLAAKEYKACWSKYAAYYTVESWFEKVTGGEYEIDSSLTVKLIGSVLNEEGNPCYTNAVAGEYTGFVTPESVEQKVIASDDSTVVKIMYDRKSVKITFDAGSGKWGLTEKTKVLNGKYGASVPAENIPENPVLDEFYEFAGWNPVLPDTLTFGAEDAVYTAKFKLTGAHYAVKYLFESLEDENVFVENQTLIPQLNGTAKIGEEITLSAVEAPAGFTAKAGNPEKLTVTADGEGQDGAYVVTSVAEIKFTRNSYTVTFNLNGGSWDGEQLDVITGKYQSPVPAVASVKKQNYEFVKWEPEVPAAFGAENVICVAEYQIARVHYSVEHYFQNTALDGYNIDSALTETFEDEAGTTVIPNAKQIEGFTNKPVDQAVISDDKDNPTVVKIYYDRNASSVRFNPVGGEWSSAIVSAYSMDDARGILTINGYYGQTVPSINSADLSKENFVFDKWNETVQTTFGTTEKTYSALWNANVTPEIGYVGDEDVVLSAKVNGTVVSEMTAGDTVLISVTAPYGDSFWTYEWYVDGAAKAGETGSVLSDEPAKGGHNYTVVATYAGKVKFTKTLMISVK